MQALYFHLFEFLYFKSTLWRRTVLVIHRFLYVVDRSIGHSTFIQYLKPICSGSQLGYFIYHGLQFDAILYSQSISGESWISLPSRLANPITKNSKQSVVTTSKKDVSVCCLESLIWDDRRYIL